MRPVIVTTELRGVFFGYVPDDALLDCETIRIEQARMCIYWSASTRGVTGLAATGPNRECRIGPAAPAITLRKVTSIMELTAEAVAAWEKAPWSV